MRAIIKLISCSLLLGASLASAQTICPLRPSPGTPVENPLDLYSQNGTLTLDLLLQNQKENDGYMHYCYVYLYNGTAIEAPTLRLNPGDHLVLNLTDNIQAPYDRYGAARKPPMEAMAGTKGRASHFFSRRSV